MSSKGPTISGTDGNDFMHRQTVASHYQISVLNKSRLNNCLKIHFLFFLVMLAKLMDNILDRMDIFILTLQELYIPKPKLWEFVWAFSFVFSFLAKRSMQKNSPNLMKVYVGMLISFSLMPVFYSLFINFNDVYHLFYKGDARQVTEKWQGFSVAALWYAFLFFVLQIHIGELTFAYSLISAWSKKNKKV